MRRSVLPLVIASLTGLPLALTAEADDLGRADKLRALYSNRFSFDSRGVPVLTIGLIEGADSVTLQSETPIRVLPEGNDGTEVIGGLRWRIERKSSRPAEVEHLVVLARASATDVVSVRKLSNLWRGHGITPRFVEVGAVYGMRGRVFDNRAILLCEGPFASHAAAVARAEQYKARGWLQKVQTTIQLKKRPSGIIEITDRVNNTRVRAKDAIWFAPYSSSDLLLISDGVANDGRITGKPGGRYRGTIYVTFDQRGKLAVVNTLAADHLLDGLVSAETFPSAPIEALKAQAVAARGNLLAKIGTQNLADPYLTCAWTRCQVYRGAGYEHRRTSAAIRATRGLVLMHKGQAVLVDAVYHALSGGFTEHNENVWPGEPDPSLRGKLDAPNGSALNAFENGITERNIHQWLSMKPQTWGARSGINKERLRWTRRVAASAIAKKLKSARLGTVLEIAVVSRGRSGRAKRVEVRGSNRSHIIRGELAIRRAFGNLPSSMFVVKAVKSGGKIVVFEFKGGGWGHGVGMSQSGAIGMALAGQKFRQILDHYYTGGELRQIY